MSKKKNTWCGGNRAAIGRQSGRAAIGRQSGGSVIFHQIPFLTQCKGSTGRKSMCLSHIHVLVPIATSVSCQKRNKFGVAAIGRQSGGNRVQSGGSVIFHQIPFLTQCKGSTGRKLLCLSHIHVLVSIATYVSCQRRKQMGVAAIGRQSGGRQSGGNRAEVVFPIKFLSWLIVKVALDVSSCV